MKIFKSIAGCFTILTLLFTSCTEYFDPSQDNRYDESRVLREAAFAEGLILDVLADLPNAYSFTESATDDAVTNVVNGSFSRMSLGEWSSQFNPVSDWGGAYQSIYQLNYFLSVVDRVEWSPMSQMRNNMFANRFKGEAYGLRAYNYLSILQRHGGKGKDGNMLGFIIMDEYRVPTAYDPSIPRSSFDECVDFILSDCDSALNLLPLDYKVFGDPDSTQVFGSVNKNRFSGRHALAIKSRVLLHAASPAYNPTPSVTKWEDAAIAAADLLQKINGLAGLSATGATWYKNQNDPDIIWRRDIVTNYTWEGQNFPPSLNGNGRDNPTQNFVDAFPMLNGYPIIDGASGYNSSMPYTGRDPRLAAYVVLNGSKIGTATINTSVESGTDGIKKTPLSTVTGYYLRKLMDEAVKLPPATPTPRVHFYTLFRYTEIFLNYAEAVNEAWGPDSDPEGYGFTARDVMLAIRKRAGITQPDAYLASISAGDKDMMRTLIRNERRIELSFEGFRFWDLRRWDLNLTETAKGMQIEGGVYSVIDVEERNYLPFMKYGPIPYSETLNNTNLYQNEGW